MGEYVIELSEAEEKAMLCNMLDIRVWINNAVHNKARQCMDNVILEHSNKQPKKISADERTKIVHKAVVKTIAEKNAEEEAKMEEQHGSKN